MAERMRSPWRLAPLAILALVALGYDAEAHLPALRGMLIELVQQSDAIVAAKVQQTQPAGAPVSATTIAVERVLLGHAAERVLTFRGAVHVAPGARYVFFLRHAGAAVECVQPSGVVFPALAKDDAAYRDTVRAIGAALRVGDPAREPRLRAALVPALSAGSAPLRYNAALELASMTEQGPRLGENERAQIEGLLSDPHTDPALRPLLSPLVSGPPDRSMKAKGPVGDRHASGGSGG
jgi:hypothetical protein